MFAQLNSLTLIKVREPPRTKLMLPYQSHSLSCLRCTFKTTYKKSHPSFTFLSFTFLGYALDRLVTVSYMCYHPSTSVLSTSSYLQNHIQEISSFVHFPILYLPWLCPRPISNSQLHVLPPFHLCPIYLVVCKGSYNLRWDICS